MSTKQIVATAGSAVIVVVLITLAAFFGTSDRPPNQSDSESLQANAQAPEFTLKNYDGESVSLEDFDKPITIINIWASWCPFCTDELPDFAKLRQEYPEQIDVIAINRGEDRQTAKNFTDQRDITDDMTFLLNPSESYYQKIGGFAMPETLFLGDSKNIFKHHRGPLSFAEMKDIIDKQLTAPSESASRGDSYGCSGGQCQTTSSSSTNHGN